MKREEDEKTNTVAAPNPGGHETRPGSRRSAPISLEQDKKLRDESYPKKLRDDMRMKDLPKEDDFDPHIEPKE